MPSSFTSNVAFEKPADGEQVNNWGDTVNDNMDITDRLTSQVGTIALLGSTYTLTTSTSGALSEGHYSTIKFTGVPGATCTVTINPSTIQRIYTVINSTDQTIVMAQGSGSTVSIAAGKGAIVYCDGAGAGAAVVDVTATFLPTLTSLGITASASELNILDGATLSTAELNTLDGITASTAEINLLDGVTATTTEINYVDGVTSSIQTQLNAKANATDASIATSISLTGGASAWRFSLSGNDLVISYGGVSKAKLDTSGNLTVTGDVTAFGTI